MNYDLQYPQPAPIRLWSSVGREAVTESEGQRFNFHQCRRISLLLRGPISMTWANDHANRYQDIQYGTVLHSVAD